MAEMKKKLGFGMMRLPMLDGPKGRKVLDEEQICRMVDDFLARGFNYFDTAVMYCGGKSEVAVGKCLASRHDRSEFYLVDKASPHVFPSEKVTKDHFINQLRLCGVDWFDTYLVHDMSVARYELAEKWGIFPWVQSLKEQGLVRHTGLSFHDSPQLLDQILTRYPELEYVQIQLNYRDWDNPVIRSRECYETAVRHGKKVLVMEPLKGGTLVRMPQDALTILEEAAPGRSIASWGIRFAASLPEVAMVLSGMSTEEQMLDNLAYMENFEPLTEAEHAVIDRVVEQLNASVAVDCTACEYCTPGCPKNIPIPQYFSLYNAELQNETDGFVSNIEYYEDLTKLRGKPSDCILCRKCEKACPQHLPITDHLKKVAEIFEK